VGTRKSGLYFQEYYGAQIANYTLHLAFKGGGYRPR